MFEIRTFSLPADRLIAPFPQALFDEGFLDRVGFTAAGQPSQQAGGPATGSADRSAAARSSGNCADGRTNRSTCRGADRCSGSRLGADARGIVTMGFGQGYTLLDSLFAGMWALRLQGCIRVKYRAFCGTSG